jgi:hypothetical protein
MGLPLVLSLILQNLSLRFMMPHLMQSGSLHSKVYSLFIGTTAWEGDTSHKFFSHKGRKCTLVNILNEDPSVFRILSIYFL